MGDRANVAVDSGDRGRVYFYTHWDGSELPETVRKALARKARWDDSEYLARIIFQQMVGEDKGETGYGISSQEMDNEYPVLVVDCVQRVVRIESPGKFYSFQDYVELEEASWGDFE